MTLYKSRQCPIHDGCKSKDCPLVHKGERQGDHGSQGFGPLFLSARIVRAFRGDVCELSGKAALSEGLRPLGPLLHIYSFKESSMTNQELYTTSRNHLLTQMKRSTMAINGHVGCAYRGEAGLKCAIGCLIPDEKYNFNLLEGKNVLFREVAVAAGIDFDESGLLDQVTGPQVKLADQLQMCHDKWDVELWKSRLDTIARDFDLIIEPQVP